MRRFTLFIAVLAVVLSAGAKFIKKDQMSAENLKKFAGSVYAY